MPPVVAATVAGASRDPTTFERTCAYCGAQMRVVAAHGPFLDHPEPYDCPECGKEYKTPAAHEPEVKLLAPRTDGKDDSYQDTMF
jgi:endogenous inhibitor of DNA gyrase (YacG/DUF329 family)